MKSAFREPNPPPVRPIFASNFFDKDVVQELSPGDLNVTEGLWKEGKALPNAAGRMVLPLLLRFSTRKNRWLSTQREVFDLLVNFYLWRY